MAPICLTHEEIKSNEDEALILMESSEILEEDAAPKFSNKLTVRGLPIESQQYVPLNFLVPHLMQQNFLYAISFANISNILVSLLMAGWQDRDEIREEVKKISLRENEIMRKTLYTTA